MRKVLIVFTIKNTRSDTVYIGTTTNSIEERWTLFQLAKDAEIEAPLYHDMRQYGVACFSIEEYDYADSRTELAELFTEAMEQYDGVSLKGMKTTLPRTAVYPTSEGAIPKTAAKSAAAKAAANSDSSDQTASASLNAKASIGSSLKSGTAKRVVATKQKVKSVTSTLSTPQAKPKLATGRTGSAIREKKIKETIELEKAARTALKLKQISEQADEMKSIMANLDSRGSTLRKRY